MRCVDSPSSPLARALARPSLFCRALLVAGDSFTGLLTPADCDRGRDPTRPATELSMTASFAGRGTGSEDAGARARLGGIAGGDRRPHGNVVVKDVDCWLAFGDGYVAGSIPKN